MVKVAATPYLWQLHQEVSVLCLAPDSKRDLGKKDLSQVSVGFGARPRHRDRVPGSSNGAS